MFGISSINMIESIAYIAIGFATAFFSLEAVWHLTACRIQDRTIKPCFYKQIRLVDWKSNILFIGIIAGIVFVCALFMLPLHESLASPR
jgi:mannose/fructose/N-acetylgalactosamine-specific phosphotransferase system component IIC